MPVGPSFPQATSWTGVQAGNGIGICGNSADLHYRWASELRAAQAREPLYAFTRQLRPGHQNTVHFCTLSLWPQILCAAPEEFVQLTTGATKLATWP